MADGIGGREASGKLRVGVVGGGAAGFFGAIACAEASPSADVTLFEAAREPLGKVRVSGGGRCNVTHHCFEPRELVGHYPRGGKALRGPLTKFQPRDTIDWFADRDVALKVEADGRMFPTTDDSETIVACLMRAAKRSGVRLLTRTPVKNIRRDPEEADKIDKTGEMGLGQFVVTTRDGTQTFDRLLLATGSSRKGYTWAQQLGQTIAEPVPSLFTFQIDDRALHELAGISVAEAIVSVPETKPHQNLTQAGPLLISHWGLSGPAVLKTSAWGARFLHDRGYRTEIRVNWLPDWKPEALRSKLQDLRQREARKTIATFSPFGFSRRLWLYLLDRADLDPKLQWAQLPKAKLNRLVDRLSRCEFQVTGKGQFKDEFVTCGGVRLKEVNFKTMESRVCPGLFFAGEILDVDGVTGGFNFQNAWTTGWLAGRAMAKSIS
ncbi:MAG: NAD(P)/FAD-dependent oxidoreductase [Geitlerinemataceae cyanobacterium]